MKNTTDFRILAQTIAHLVQKNHLDDVELELVQLYKYAYYDGLNNGWAREQDKELNRKEQDDKKD